MYWVNKEHLHKRETGTSRKQTKEVWGTDGMVASTNITSGDWIQAYVWEEKRTEFLKKDTKRKKYEILGK